MAKKQLSAGAKDLLSRLKKTSSIDDANVFSKADLYQQKESIPTPIPLVNLALSGRFFTGGVTPGLTLWAGERATFKTMYSLLCMQSYLDYYEDAVGIIYDSEFSMTKEYLRSFGIDEERVFITPIEDIDKLKNDVINQLDGINRGERAFLLIDSVGNLASLKEISDAQDGKSTQDMTRAKMLKSLFRMITPRINLKGIPFHAIMHTYQTQELYSKTIISGGTGALYSANNAMVLNKRKNQNKEEAGFEFVIKIEKSRFIREGLKFAITIPEGGQIKKYSGMFDLALETGFIVKEGMKYSVPELPDFEKAWKKDIEDSDEFWTMMFEKTSFVKSVEDGIKVSVDQSSLFKTGENSLLESPQETYSESERD